MNLVTMKKMMRDAGIRREDIDFTSSLAWNFAAQYLHNEKLVELVDELPKEEIYELSKRLLRG